MINEQVFANWMAALGARVAKEAPAQLLAIYYKTLSSCLDTAQFEAAMTRMISRPATYFTAWPSPVEIIDAAELAPVFDAIAAFAELETWLSLRAHDRPLLPQLEAHCDARTVRVFQALGGVLRYDRLTRYNEDAYRREFVDRLTDLVEHEAINQLAALPPHREPAQLTP